MRMASVIAQARADGLPFVASINDDLTSALTDALLMKEAGEHSVVIHEGNDPRDGALCIVAVCFLSYEEVN